MIPEICTLIDTDYGRMIVPCHDINQTGALVKTGRGVHDASVQLLNGLLDKMPPGRVVIDAGANIGCFTLGMAPYVDGWLHAFEAQPMIANMLAGSVALSQRQNIRVYNVCLGEKPDIVEVPQFRYDQRLNFGSIEFGSEQIEQLDQKRGNDPDMMEYVDVNPLDLYGFQRVDLIKIDVQRMEIPLLKGAKLTLERCRPVLFIEWVGHDLSMLRAAIESFGYRIDREFEDDWLCFPL